MTSTLTDRIYGESASVAVKAPCQAATVGVPLPLVGLTAVGSYTPFEGDRILVKDQSDPTTNGVYNASTGAWARAGDFDGPYDAVQGTLIVVLYSNAQASIYQLSNPNPVIGTSLLTFSPLVNPNQNYQQTPAEAAMGVSIVNAGYDVGRSLRYGIVPNLASAADANTAIMRQLVAYGLNNTGWTGNFEFTNITGVDTYYFSNYIDFRPGIDVDLQDCTLNFTKVAPDATDVNSGFVSAIRDFNIKNGYIVVNFSCANGGHGLMFGCKGDDGTYFAPLFDADYYAATGSTFGNISVKNVKVTSNNPGNRCLLMFGGLQNVSIENFWMEGSGVSDGCYYEFGWATNAGGVLANRQTSHANNLSFRNIKATNLSTTVGNAIQCNGAYNWSVDGLKVIIAAGCIGAGFGESWFYNPWASVDDGQVNKRGFTARNIVGKGIQGIGIGIIGANISPVATGYLAATINAISAPGLWAVQTDLMSAIIDGFDINGTVNNNGIQVQGAQQLSISNGRLVGFQKGINTTDEVTLYAIRNVHVLQSGGPGISIGGGFDVWTPPRLSMGSIEGCFIAGSGQSGTQPAINIGSSLYCLIKGNRLGAELIHDGVAETTQGQGVLMGATATGVICDSNYVNTSGGAPAYQKTAGPAGCTIINPMGLATITGTLLYGGAPEQANLVYSASMTPDCTQATEFVINAGNGAAFTINAPLNPMQGMQALINIRNATGGALGAATFNGVFHLAGAWTQPGAGNQRSLLLRFDGAVWYEISRTAADVAN